MAIRAFDLTDTFEVVNVQLLVFIVKVETSTSKRSMKMTKRSMGMMDMKIMMLP